ncbi:sensor histidine kinase [Coleofasciculus sp. H7-2]|uniref:sensor histidine kinase n=1 Tax=Coleofasciculus sp. H7-2 TaxID=3351545 RepID=UPI00366F2A70
MKVGIKRFAVQVHPPSSTLGSLGTPYPPDLRSICQLHLELIAAQLPVVAAWIVYQDSDTQKRQLVADYPDKRQGNYAELPQFFAEVGWEDSLPVLKLSEVTKSAKSASADAACSYYTYVCPLSEQKAKEAEYLLLWSRTPLSWLQQQGVEKQAQLLSHYLVMSRECSRQKAEIQLLEQVLGRTEHQLRNPLALISLYAENLCLGLPSGGLQDQAEIVRETVNELIENLTDLVYCGQQAKLQVAPYELRKTLAESIQGLQPWLEQKQLYVRYPEKPITLAGDRWQMKQVFDNLLSNAVHFSPPGGIITCNWQVFQSEVIVEVSDLGSGLSEEDLKQVFTPFYSKRPGGTGLGLAIAKKIILDHQGTIWVENLPSGGAQFSFTLPRPQFSVGLGE